MVKFPAELIGTEAIVTGTVKAASAAIWTSTVAVPLIADTLPWISTTGALATSSSCQYCVARTSRLTLFELAVGDEIEPAPSGWSLVAPSGGNLRYVDAH